jgi:cobalt-zinc-cadmium efflux system outer membrane protein
MPRRDIVGVLIAVCAAVGLLRAQTAGSVLGVDDLVRMAIERNGDMLAARQRMAETQGLLRQAGVRPAPALEIEESSSRPFGSRGEQVLSAGYFHTIETFGKRDKRMAVALKSSEAAEAELADRERLLTLDVKVKYVQARREQLKLQALQRLASTNRQYYDLTSVRVERGDAAPLERQLLLTDVNRVEVQRIVLGSSADRALLELRKIVGLPIGEPLALATTAPPAETSTGTAELVARALRTRPDLVALRRLEEQAQAEEELARAEGRTDLTASVRYSRTESHLDQLAFDSSGQLAPIHDRDNVLSLGLSIFLFQPRRNQGAIEAAQARTTAARLRREQQELVVRLEVEAAFRRWASARQAVDLLNSGVVDQSERNLTVIRQAYSLGHLRILDVLNEQRRLIDTEMAYVDAQSEWFEAFAELEASVGGPIQ